MKTSREEHDEQAQEKAEAERKAQLDRLRKLLGTIEGYDLVCRIVDYCRVFDSIWSPSAEIHKNAGRQEVGQWLYKEVAQASPQTAARLLMDLTIEEPARIATRQRKEK